MKKKQLAGRLARLRASKGPGVHPPPLHASSAPGQNFSPEFINRGWEKLSDYLFRRVTPLPPVDIRPLLSSHPILLPVGEPAENLLFYDLETSGLSGGAGTAVFLAGFLRLVPVENRGGENTFFIPEATQLFLADFPGERDFLEAIGELIKPQSLYLSYNGKGFDRHLLASKFRLHALQLSMPRQLDLLYPARKFWKDRLPDCSLSTVEQEILGIWRELDIPGREIPDRYFSWLKSFDIEVMEPVFAHHLQDILSLLLLLRRFESMALSPCDCTAREKGVLGELRYHTGSRDDALKLLQLAWEEGNARAGRVAVLLLKRMGYRGKAAELAGQMWEQKRSLFAGIELAKYYEHVEHNPTAALELVEAMLERRAFLSDRIRKQLYHRRGRLIKRL
jgi:hypothetical protein